MNEINVGGTNHIYYTSIEERERGDDKSAKEVARKPGNKEI